MTNKTTLLEDLVQGLTEIEQHLQGKIELTSYTLKRPDEEVKAIRNELNLSQIELAQKLKMSVRTLQNWEQGRTVPNLHSLMLLRMASKEPKLFDVVAGM